MRRKIEKTAERYEARPHGGLGAGWVVYDTKLNEVAQYDCRNKRDARFEAMKLNRPSGPRS